MPSTGLIFESYRFKDISHEQVFGSAPSDLEIKPLNRDTSGIPVVYQGHVNTCVACTITWIKQFMLKEAKQDIERLSWPFLAEISHIGPRGAAPSQVLKPAYKTGICKWDTFNQKTIEEAIQEAWGFQIPAYSFLTDYSKENIYAALERGPLAVGVLNWKGAGDHMMAAYDVTEDGKLRVKSWWDEDHQTEEIIDFDQIEVAISFVPFLQRPGLRISALDVFWDKIVSLFKYHG